MKHGIILKSLPEPPANTLSEITKANVIQFYELDEISSVAPGKKDVAIISDQKMAHASKFKNDIW